jgi:hypothetical protein
MALRRVALATTAFCLSACALITGVGDLEIAATLSGDAESDADTRVTSPPDAGPTDAQASCAAPARCVAAPPGWDGPFAVLLAKEGSGGSLACPAALTRSWERADMTDASIPPAQCTCSCGALGGTCSVTISEYAQNDACLGNPATFPLTTNVCRVLAERTDSFRAMSTATAACPPDASTTLPAFDAGSSAIGCSPTEPAGCAGGVCMPALSPPTRLCVRPTGATAGACPADYPDELTLSAGVEDTRRCSPCSCNAAATCPFTYGAYSSSSCSTSMRAYADTDCHTASFRRGVKLTDASVAGACVPEGGAPTGSVDVRPSLSLCCAR